MLPATARPTNVDAGTGSATGVLSTSALRTVLASSTVGDRPALSTYALVAASVGVVGADTLVTSWPAKDTGPVGAAIWSSRLVRTRVSKSEMSAATRASSVLSCAGVRAAIGPAAARPTTVEGPTASAMGVSSTSALTRLLASHVSGGTPEGPVAGVVQVVSKSAGLALASTSLVAPPVGTPGPATPGGPSGPTVPVPPPEPGATGVRSESPGMR